MGITHKNEFYVITVTANVRNHPLVKKNQETLQLAFYFDDLEVANPLGSKRGKYKLGKVLK